MLRQNYSSIFPQDSVVNHSSAMEVPNKPDIISQLVNCEIEEEIEHAASEGHRNLYLNYKGLRSLPESVYTRCEHIHKLYVKRNVLSVLPPQISRLRHLTELYLHSNCLRHLPDEIGLVTTLVSLDVSNNQLVSLPATTGLLHNLHRLQASSNALTQLPAQIGYLKQLRTLQVADNHIQRLPEEVGDCRSLRCLMVDSNLLTSLPDSLHRCLALEEVYLNGNRLLFVPPNLTALRPYALRSIFVDSNPLLQALPVALTPYIRGFGNGVVRGQVPRVKFLIQIITSQGDVINLPPQIQHVKHPAAGGVGVGGSGCMTLTLLELSLRAVARHSHTLDVGTLPRKLREVLRGPTAWCGGACRGGATGATGATAPQPLYTDVHLVVGTVAPPAHHADSDPVLTTNMCCSLACCRAATTANRNTHLNFQPLSWTVWT